MEALHPPFGQWMIHDGEIFVKSFFYFMFVKKENF